ncbi:MAG: TraR/DksA C4-type zinc finger protein [candidate division KSB1 bacterium]|nr:TraR/DksA C4-type zinc finger protein [candidate division KSB1 bacterium]
MDKETLEHFKALIEEKRAELLRQLEQMEANGLKTSLRESTGNHSSYSLHMADQGTDTMAQEQQFMMASREQNYLYHLNLALERIEKGEFGICVRCGKEISRERLEAVPHVRLCIECKEKEERRKR